MRIIMVTLPCSKCGKPATFTLWDEHPIPEERWCVDCTKAEYMKEYIIGQENST